MSRRFLIGALLAAGFGPSDPLQATVTGVAPPGPDPDGQSLFKLFRQDHVYTLAQHRSHRSHSSHSSHRSGSGGHSSHYSHTSHRSSAGGYAVPTYTPAPVYSPPSSSSGSYGSSNSSSSSGTRSLYGTPSPNAGAVPALSGRTTLFKIIVMKVQVALMGHGLFQGPIDGEVGPKTRSALRTFQQRFGLSATGTITPETLDALHVPSQ